MTEQEDMERFTVELIPYSTDWPRKYANEKALIESGALQSVAHEIEHIGSTSVEGATAKPIVDIAVKLDAVSLVAGLVEPLEKLGYKYMEEFGLPGRHFFIKGNPRQFHLHIVDDTSEHWERWIKFRDTLKQHPELLEEYLALKAELAEKYHDKREKYTQAKSEFINSVLSDELY